MNQPIYRPEKKGATPYWYLEGMDVEYRHDQGCRSWFTAQPYWYVSFEYRPVKPLTEQFDAAHPKWRVMKRPEGTIASDGFIPTTPRENYDWHIAEARKYCHADVVFPEYVEPEDNWDRLAIELNCGKGWASDIRRVAASLGLELTNAEP